MMLAPPACHGDSCGRGQSIASRLTAGSAIADLDQNFISQHDRIPNYFLVTEAMAEG